MAFLKNFSTLYEAAFHNCYEVWIEENAGLNFVKAQGEDR